MLVDVTGLILYFSVASVILRGTLLYPPFNSRINSCRW